MGKIQRQHEAEIRLLVEIRPSCICASAEVAIQGLQRLIQIAGFVVPEPISTCAHVACLSHPVRSELVLHGQIPVQYPRNQTLRPGGLDGAVDVDWI